jgi:hypothetical protein
MGGETAAAAAAEADTTRWSKRYDTIPMAVVLVQILVALSCSYLYIYIDQRIE